MTSREAGSPRRRVSGWASLARPAVLGQMHGLPAACGPAGAMTADRTAGPDAAAASCQRTLLRESVASHMLWQPQSVDAWPTPVCAASLGLVQTRRRRRMTSREAGSPRRRVSGWASLARPAVLGQMHGLPAACGPAAAMTADRTAGPDAAAASCQRTLLRESVASHMLWQPQSVDTFRIHVSVPSRVSVQMRTAGATRSLAGASVACGVASLR